MKLKLETNPRNCLDLSVHLPSGALFLLTAPLQRECWLFRVSFPNHFALVAVPVFGGVDVQWRSGDSCKLIQPLEISSEQLVKNLRPHAGRSVSAAALTAAIQLLQDAVKQFRGAANQAPR